MIFLLPTFAVALSAFCIWLVVRVVNRKERWAKWTLAGVVGVPVLYFLSVAPAEWMRRRGWFSEGVENAVGRFYEPIGIVQAECPVPIQRAISWYERLLVQ